MQEPIKHTENEATTGSALPDYQPDDASLHLFRKIGRVGNAVSLLNIFSLAYQVYITASYYRLVTRETAYLPPAAIRTEYAVRFGFLLLLCLLTLLSTFMLLRASRSLLQYGSEPDNTSMYRSVKSLYTWFISLLAGTIVNALYFGYVFMRTGNL